MSSEGRLQSKKKIRITYYWIDLVHLAGFEAILNAVIYRDMHSSSSLAQLADIV